MLTKLKSLFTQPVVIISSLIVTASLFGIQRLGVLEQFELRVWDQMMQLRPPQNPDSRLLVVSVTEQDLQKYNWPLSGEILDTLLGKLEQYQPRAIGLDIFRDLPVEPGHSKLLQRLQQSDIIVTVCKHSDATHPETPPPQGIEANRVGFSDLIEDTDGTIRRNLLTLSTQPKQRCTTPYSLSLQLALKYLQVQGIQAQQTSNQELQIGAAIFKRLQNDSGAYQNADARGYQILLSYHSPDQVAQSVTLTEILSKQIKPELVKDRIVLIGSTAPSLKDIFNTPYSSGKVDNSGKMAGVFIHANSVSQIIDAALNQKPLFWFIPEWGEVIWIWTWAIVGGVIAFYIQHPIRLALVGGASGAILFASNFVIFTQAGWLPVISPALGFVLTVGTTLAYIAHRRGEFEKQIAQRVQEQEQAIAQLREMLRQGESSPGLATTIVPINELQENLLLNNRYKIIEKLSSGGFGNTYIAEDTTFPGTPRCVVKQFKPAIQNEEYVEVARRLFKTEAEILKLLGNHDGIPQMLAYFEEEQHFYLVQEFIQGSTLDTEIKPNNLLSPVEVREILEDVLQILVYVHKHSVIHRDIKPGNLIRRKQDKRIVLIDFGAVKQIESQQSEALTVAIGSAGYAPREQLDGRPQLNSDIYALGILAIQALTGAIPARQFIRNESNGELLIKQNANTNPQNWRNIANISPEFAAILDKMVQINPTLRYQSVTEVLDSLKIIHD